MLDPTQVSLQVLQGEIGTIEVGRLADLVLLNSDPLEDIRNTRDIWQVIQGGQIVDREALLERAKQEDKAGWFWLGY